LSHVVTGLTNGIAYTFTVRATTLFGTGDPSAPSNSVTPAGPPGPPVAIVAVGGDSSATVSFAAPLDDGGSAVTGYTVVSNPAGGVDVNDGFVTLAHLVTGLTNGVPYTFTVTATNGVGTSSPSKASNEVTPNVPQVQTK
ncbi:MAG: fibronectin type III domain-containing protein, partial [Thermoanaerobaculia bacterium]